MATRKATKKAQDPLVMDYDVTRDIAMWFLRELKRNVESYIDEIAKDVEHKNAYPAQLEDYYMYKEVLYGVETVLKFHGVDSDTK